MKKPSLVCLAALFLIADAAAQLPGLSVLREKLESYQIDFPSFTTTKEGNVIMRGKPGHIRADDIEVYANQAEYIAASEQFRFSGDVAIYKDGLIYRGEKATYHTGTGQLDATGMRSSIEPLFFTSADLSISGNEISIIQANETDFTTEDDPDAAFHIKSGRVTIYPQERVVFRRMKAYAGDTPVFYLPYLSQPLEAGLGYTFTPGFRSNLGAFLLNRYGVPVGDHSILAYRLDLYSARGVGAGIDFESRRYDTVSAFGKFKFYWVHDTDPLTSNTSSIPRTDAEVDSNRYRINLQHRVYLPGPEESDLYLDADINKLSDEFFYEDYYPHEFRDDPQPDNILSLIKRHERGEFSIMGRFRVNDFYTSDSRLPEIALDMVRQPVFNTGLYYAGNTSFGVLREEPGNDDANRLRESIEAIDTQLTDPLLAPGLDPAETNATLADLRAQLLETEFTRFHTYHELFYPFSSANSFTVTPRLGVGYTSYSSVSGPSPDASGRTLFNAGMEASFKMSKTYDDVTHAALGLDGLRHVVQPYVNWSFVSADSLGDDFRGIDRLVLSTRPRPLDVANFTAIDSLRDWNIVRLGVFNRLQTKRNRGTYNWLSANTYIDAFIDDPEFDRSLSNVYQDVEWRPVHWSKLNFTAQVPTGSDFNFTEVNTRATFMPIDDLEFTVGHRFLKDHPFFQDSNLIDFGAYARINERWGFSIYERYEFDDNVLETQQYTLHRDLTSWVASLGAIVRDNRGENEWGILFSLTLKDFPSLSLPLDIDPSGGRR